MSFTVRELPRAKLDKRQIFEWIFERSPQGAAAWLNAYDEMTARLRSAADRLAHAVENEDVELEIRQVLFRTRRGRIYRAVFHIVGRDVFILRVRGPGQAPVGPTDLTGAFSETKASAQYEEVIRTLTAAGYRAQFHGPGQLVVCRREPVLSGRIWITWRGCWYISTWTPAVYLVPDETNIVGLCVACVDDTRGAQPFHLIPEAIVQQFALRRLDELETQLLLETMS